MEGQKRLSYFNGSFSPTKVRQLLRFRLGCHTLPVVSGRRNGIPRHERDCQRCCAGFGDEKHVLFECSALQDIRDKFLCLFDGVYDMRTFMSQFDQRAISNLFA